MKMVRFGPAHSLFALVVFIVPLANALYSQITFGSSGANTSTVGCLASSYSSVPSVSHADFVRADPVTLCAFDSNYGWHVSINSATGASAFIGKVVYVERSDCNPSAVASLLSYYGAVGLVFGNSYEGEVPWELAFSSTYFYVYFEYGDNSGAWGFGFTGNYVDENTKIPGFVMCMASYEETRGLKDALPTVNDADSSVASVTVDISSVVDNAAWETSPQHINTAVVFDWTVTTNGKALKGSYTAPAAQALYNIPGRAGYQASVVEVEIATSCFQLSTYGQCLECWASSSPFANAEALNGSIALITADAAASLSCYYFYYELSYEAELAGAVGVLFGESNNVQSSFEPVGIPYQASGNTFGILHITAERLTSILNMANASSTTTVVVELTATFPATDEWIPPSGPEYFPSADDDGDVATGGTLPFTTILLGTSATPSILQDSSDPSAADFVLSLEAGQSTFAPETSNATWAFVAVVDLEPDCASENDRCDSCAIAADEGSVVLSSRATLEGRVGVLNASLFSCLASIHSIVSELETLGAKGCVVVNNHDAVYTEEPEELTVATDGLVRVGIPYFNVKHSAYTSALQAAGTSWDNQANEDVALFLPPLNNYSAVALNLTGIVNQEDPTICRAPAMPLTEIAVGMSLLAQGSSATYLTAGQASFNPESHAGIFNAPIVPLRLDDTCTSKSGCGSCERSGFPFVAGTWNTATNNDILRDDAAAAVIVASSLPSMSLLHGSVAAFEVSGDFLCFPLFYFAKLISAHGATGVVVINSNDDIFTLSGDTYTGSDCDVERLSNTLTFDVPRESGQTMARIFGDSTETSSLSAVLPFTDTSGVAPESIDAHYSTWVDSVAGSDGDGGGSGGPEDDSGEVIDPDAPLPGGPGGGAGPGGILVVGAWSEWSACSMECFGVEGFFPGTRQRNRTCTTQYTLTIGIGVEDPVRRLQVEPVVVVGQDGDGSDENGCSGDVTSTEAEQCNLQECEGQLDDVGAEYIDVQLYFPQAKFYPQPGMPQVDLHDNHTILYTVLPGLVDELATAALGSSGELFFQFYLATFGTPRAHDNGSVDSESEACYVQVRLIAVANTDDAAEQAVEAIDDFVKSGERPATYTWLKYLDDDYEPTEDWYTGTWFGSVESPAGASDAGSVAAIVISVLLVLVVASVVVAVVVERRRRALRLAVYSGVTTSVQTVEPANPGERGDNDSTSDENSRGNFGSTRTKGRVLTPRPYTPAQPKVVQKNGRTVISHTVRTVEVASARVSDSHHETV